MRTDVRAIVKANDVLVLKYKDDSLTFGRGMMNVDLKGIKERYKNFEQCKICFSTFDEWSKGEIKRLLDLLVFCRK